MGWTPEKIMEIKNQRTAQIIKAALELFAQKGYFATNIEEISKRAGIAKGLIYKYFDSKQELLETIIQLLIRKHKEYLPTISGKELTYEQLENLLIEFFKDIKANITQWKVLYSIISQPSIAELYQQAIAEDMKKVQQFFIEFFSKQECDAQACYLLFLSAVEGLIYNYIVNPQLDIKPAIKALIQSLKCQQKTNSKI